MTTNPMVDSDMARCIRNCFTAHRACLETLHHMLSQKSTRFQGKEIALLQLCADTCELSAKMMIADVSFHHQSCELCFQICDACAVECESYPEDREMQRCADLLRQCAESCRGMAGMTVVAPAKERKPPETILQT